jgi:hypothetical protein
MKTGLTVSCCLAALTVVSTAAADPAFTLGRPSAAARLQYGMDMSDLEANIYSLGAGVRGGYTLDAAVYMGLSFDYFLGSTADGFEGEEYSGKAWQLMAEGGYDIGLSPTIVLRPQLGFGMVGWSLERCFTRLGEECESESASDVAMAPGAVGLFELGGFFLSGEMRYDIIFGDPTQSALFIGVGAGMAF